MTGTPAGWHPAPGRPDQLRYWDGTAWTAHYAPAGGPVMQPPPPKKSGKKLWVALGAVAVLLVGCTAIGLATSEDDTADDTSSESSEDSAVDQPTKEPTKEPKPATDLEILTEEIVGDSDTEDQHVTVTETRKGVYEVGFDIDDNLSDGLIESGAIRDAFSILEEAAKADAPFKRIAIRGYFPLVDQNGQEIPHDDGWILYGEFTAKTVGLLEPDNIDTGDRDALDAVSADGLIWKGAVFG